MQVERHVQPDSALAEAVFRTVLYADVFDFPLAEAEIHHFLIGCAASLDDVKATLAESPFLTKHLEERDGYYAMRGRTANIAIRIARDNASRQLWPVAIRYGRLLAHLPFVRMVALTGSLAMRNARNPHDDIDYMIVTAPGRVWLARAMAVLIVKLAKLRRIWLCPNYVIAESAIAMNPDQCTLYMAHEVVQMIPLSGIALYESFRNTNRWVDLHIPNATKPFYIEVDRRPRGIGRFLQRVGEVLLSGPIGDSLEHWEHRRKQRKFAREISDRSSARLDDQQVKGHFQDHGRPILDQYESRLRAAELAEYQLTD